MGEPHLTTSTIEARPAGAAPERARARRPVLRFALGFVGIAAGLQFVLLTWAPSSSIFRAWLELQAVLGAGSLGLLGFDVHIEGTSLVLGAKSIEIKRGCDALQPIGLYAAAVVAFPVDWRARLRGLLAGLPALAAINVVRISSLFVLSVHAPSFFEPAHLSVWPVAYLLAAMVAWFVWVRGTEAR